MFYDILYLKGTPQNLKVLILPLRINTCMEAFQALLWEILTEPHASHGSGRLGQRQSGHYQRIRVPSPSFFPQELPWVIASTPHHHAKPSLGRFHDNGEVLTIMRKYWGGKTNTPLSQEVQYIKIKVSQFSLKVTKETNRKTINPQKLAGDNMWTEFLIFVTTTSVHINRNFPSEKLKTKNISTSYN